MIVFGLILVLLALAAGVVLFLATDSLTTPVNLELGGYHWGMTPLALLATGAVAMLLLWLGLGIIRGSAKRRRRPIREAKDAERQAKLEESIRADERARAEETHQSALAERDRVRDEEFQTRLADRDRERDSDLASREEEFASREKASEQRVRADERRKVEQELASRTSGTGTAGAAGLGAAAGVGAADAARPAATSTATSAGAETTDADATTGRHSSDAETDSGSTYGRTETETDADGDADADSGARLQSGQASTDSTQVLERDGGDVAGGSRDAEASEAQTAENDPANPGHRTVADKITGRDPAARE